MISINRYICVAAASVYGGQAIGLKTNQDESAALLTDETTAREELTETVKRQQAVLPNIKQLKTVQQNTYLDYGAHTFQTHKWGQRLKALHGSGVSLTSAEQGVTMSAVALAYAFNEQSDSSDSELSGACAYVIAKKAIPSKWESSHTKRWNGVKKAVSKKASNVRKYVSQKAVNGLRNTKAFFKGFKCWGSSFVQRGFYKSHCRLTGASLDADKVSDEETGIKLSTEKNDECPEGVEASVARIFRGAGFSNAKRVFEIMNGSKVGVEERRSLLTALLKVDIRCESPIARKLMVQEFDDLVTKPRSEVSYQEGFVTIISQTPFFLVLASTQFKDEIPEFNNKSFAVKKTIFDTWPSSIIAQEKEVDVNNKAEFFLERARLFHKDRRNKFRANAIKMFQTVIGSVEKRSFEVFDVHMDLVDRPADAGADQEEMVTIRFQHTKTLAAQHLKAPMCMQGTSRWYSPEPTASGTVSHASALVQIQPKGLDFGLRVHEAVFVAIGLVALIVLAGVVGHWTGVAVASITILVVFAACITYRLYEAKQELADQAAQAAAASASVDPLSQNVMNDVQAALGVAGEAVPIVTPTPAAVGSGSFPGTGHVLGGAGSDGSDGGAGGQQGVDVRALSAGSNVSATSAPGAQQPQQQQLQTMQQQQQQQQQQQALVLQIRALQQQQQQQQQDYDRISQQILQARGHGQVPAADLLERQRAAFAAWQQTYQQINALFGGR